MSRNRIDWARLGVAATGAAGTGLFFLLPSSSAYLPIYGDSLSAWSEWAPIHPTDARHGVAMLFLAYLLYMALAVYMANLVRKSDMWTRLLANIATVAIGVKFAIEVVLIAVLNVATEVGEESFNRSMSELGTQLSVLSLAPFAVLLLALGASALISRAVPVWLAWFTLAVGALQALATFLGLTGPPPLSPALLAVATVWFLTIPLWPLVTSVTLIVVVVLGGNPQGSTTVEAAQPA
jgi:hypothetical protein